MKTTASVDYFSEILTQLRRSPSITRGMLASAMGISLSLANRLVNELLEVGLISEQGQLESSGGRPANLLALNPRAAYTVGIDYGDIHQSAVLVDLCGKVIAHIYETVTPTEKQAEVVESILDLARRVSAEAGVPPERILGLGVGVRDIVDASTGVVHGNNGQIGWGNVWVDFPLRDALRAKTSYPHLMVDDIVRAMGTAEAIYSTRSTGKDFLFILADEGIGMAIMLDGKPFTGFSHIAGEIGHVPVADGPMCTCGNLGCLCLHAATRPILEKTRGRLKGQPQWSTLRQSEAIEIDQVIQAGAQGDKLAYQALTEAGEYMGKGLAIVVNLLGPQRIVLGGKLSESDGYLQAAHHEIRISALDKASRYVQVERSELGELAGPLGAATLILNALFEPGGRSILQLARELNRTSRLPANPDAAGTIGAAAAPKTGL